MPTVIELPHSALTAFDRRRPGRIEDVSPALLPLLRGGAVNDNQDAACAGPASEADDPDSLAAVRGVILAVGASVAFWLFVLGAILGWWL